MSAPVSPSELGLSLSDAGSWGALSSLILLIALLSRSMRREAAGWVDFWRRLRKPPQMPAKPVEALAHSETSEMISPDSLKLITELSDLLGAMQDQAVWARKQVEALVVERNALAIENKRLAAFIIQHHLSPDANTPRPGPSTP